MRDQQLPGVLLAAGAAAIIGSSVAASSLIASYSPLASQAVRYGVAAGAMGLVLWRRRSPAPRLGLGDLGRMLTLALTGLVGFNLCLLAALRQADAATVGVVVGCMPVALALLAPLLQRRSLNSRVLASAVLVSVGAAVVQGSGAITVLGLLLALGAMIGEACFSLLAAPLLPRLGPLALSTYVCATAGLVFAGAAIVVDGPHALSSLTWPRAVAIGYLGLVVTVGGFLMWFGGLSRLGLERTGLFAGIIPISALLCTVLVGASALTPLRGLGAGLVGLAVVCGLTGHGAARTRRRSSIPLWRPFGHRAPKRSSG
jgi:drug/metabolite transporter (DMT)-like permease